MLNEVRLIGHLGQDPEVKPVANGSVKVMYSVATNDSFKNREGERITQTEWHRVIAWHKDPASVPNFKKADLVVVQGKIIYRTWQDDQGNQRYSTEISLRRIQLIPTRRKSGSVLNDEGKEVIDGSGDSAESDMGTDSSEDADLPF